MCADHTNQLITRKAPPYGGLVPRKLPAWNQWTFANKHWTYHGIAEFGSGTAGYLSSWHVKNQKIDDEPSSAPDRSRQFHTKEHGDRKLETFQWINGLWMKNDGNIYHWQVRFPKNPKGIREHINKLHCGNKLDGSCSGCGEDWISTAQLAFEMCLSAPVLWSNRCWLGKPNLTYELMSLVISCSS